MNLTVAKTEDVLSDGDHNYFDELAGRASRDGLQLSPEQLRRAPSIFMPNLPGHSTGVFQESPLEGFTGEASAMLKNKFTQHQNCVYSEPRDIFTNPSRADVIQ